MAQNEITTDKFLALAKGLQEIQKVGLKHKSLTIWIYFSKYKVEKRLGGDGKPHPSIEIKFFFSNDKKPKSYTFYDWYKLNMILDNLYQMEYDLKDYKDIFKIIEKTKENIF